MKKNAIAFLTSGGDSPGMNSAIRSIVRTSIKKGYDCYAIYNGYSGLVHNDIRLIKWDDVSGIIKIGGTIIGTARCMEYKNEIKARRQAVFNLISLGIDKVVFIGGDGSLTGAYFLSKEWSSHLSELQKEGAISEKESKAYPELKIVGMVGSIDNDFYGSSMMIGCDTALHRIIYAIDSILTTAFSHRRAFIIEVMGRDSGYLALVSSVISGADYVLIPEAPVKDGWEEEMCESIKKNNSLLQDKKHIIVILSEGAKDVHGKSVTSEHVKTVLEKKLLYDTRVTILGHVQRGGSPTSYDRYLATVTGAKAVETLLSDSTTPYVIGMNGMKVNKVNLLEAVEKTRQSPELIRKGEYEKVIDLRGDEFREMLIVKSMFQQPKISNSKGPRIGILNLGASAPGMNTCVKTIVQAGIYSGFKMIGINQGLKGLSQKNYHEMKWASVIDWEKTGGSSLGTNRISLDQIGIDNVINNIKDFDALIMIGGFDGYHDMYKLSRAIDEKIPIICIPATVSNNCPSTEVSIGLDTALNNVIQACDSLSDSGVSHFKRLYMVEVTGKDCGCMTLLSGISSGSGAVFLPEKDLRIKRIMSDIHNLNSIFTKDQQVMLFIMNEKSSDVYSSEFLEKIFQKETNEDISVRSTKLGHIISGGNPTPIDRINAIRMGNKAIEYLVKNRKKSIMIGLKESKVIFTDLKEFPNLVDLKKRNVKDRWWEELEFLVNDLSSLYSKL